MGRLMTGALLILAFVIINMFVALAETGAATDPGVVQCNADRTECNDLSKDSFLSILFKTPVRGIAGLPAWLNMVYVTIGGFLLTVGILLVVVSFLPTTSE